MATWATLLDEIQDEYDLSEETFVDEDELMVYANDGIEFIEAKLVATNEDYFRASTTASLVSGTSTVAFPTDIYANKLKGVFYDYNNTKYEVKPIKTVKHTLDVHSGDNFRYIVTNITGTGPKIKLYPTPASSETNALTVWYVRNITRFATTADELDVPEAKAFIKQFVIDKAKAKETMSPDAPLSPKCERLLNDLISALTTMIPDENNEVLMDTSFYNDAEGFCNGG